MTYFLAKDSAPQFEVNVPSDVSLEVEQRIAEAIQEERRKHESRNEKVNSKKAFEEMSFI